MSAKTEIRIFDFLGKWPLAALFSAALIAGSFYLWFSLAESKYGIDFVGGHEIIVSLPPEADGAKVRSSLREANFDGLNVQAFESAGNEFAIRMKGDAEDSSVVRERILSALKAKFGDQAQILAADFIGPTVGKELQTKALLAVTIGLLGMLIYITFRFEFAFALGAVVALFHDVVVAMGIYLAVGHTINMATLAAVLTIVGYSVNDTIVIFDRVREELQRRRDMDLVELLNYSISATLSRTIITSLLTLFSAAALLIYGGGAIADLSLFLVVGIISGTYSTIFIATPVALAWEKFRAGKSA